MAEVNLPERHWPPVYDTVTAYFLRCMSGLSVTSMLMMRSERNWRASLPSKESAESAEAILRSEHLAVLDMDQKNRPSYSFPPGQSFASYLPPCRMSSAHPLSELYLKLRYRKYRFCSTFLSLPARDLGSERRYAFLLHGCRWRYHTVVAVTILTVSPTGHVRCVHVRGSTGGVESLTHLSPSC